MYIILHKVKSRFFIFTFLFFFVDLLVFHAGNIAAQNLEQTLAFASDQYKTGNYSSAIAAFHRVLYFDNGENRAAAFQTLGDCYFHTGRYEEAVKNYGLAYFSEKKDSVRNELILKSTQNYLLMNDYLAAQAELFNLPENLAPFFEKKKNFYLAITHWGLNDFALSEKYFLACLDNENDSAAFSIRQEFVELDKIRIKSKTAAILSMIIPGAGQLYCGDYKNAINSFVINIAFLGLYLYVMKAYSFFDALLSVFPWFQRYYTGGIKKSEIIAIRKINEKRNAIYQNIMDIIASAKN